jgi:hypothetical protein
MRESGINHTPAPSALGSCWLGFSLNARTKANSHIGDWQ